MFDFYNQKKVMVTGHTGFKGSWLCRMLSLAGANVVGYSLSPPTDPNLFSISGVESKIKSVMGDICHREKLLSVVKSEQPEIVIHMAAQPIVRYSYQNPVLTYETNVMGTVNICEAVRLNSSVKSFLNITTDKVYKNNEVNRGYMEDEPLDGFDPYSNSKSCSELVTHSYINSFYSHMDVAVSTARAGNVIGGGDFSLDRIIPDCVRAAEKNEEIIVRNPHSIRPYQHVLEPLYAYLMIAMMQYEDKEYAGFYNVGPNDSSCVTTGELVDLFCNVWNEDIPENKRIRWVNKSEENAPHEAGFLKLDCTRLKRTFNWNPRFEIKEAVEKTVEWTKIYLSSGDVQGCMDRQIKNYFEGGVVK